MIDRIKGLRKQGRTWKQIADELDSNAERVRSIYRRNKNNKQGQKEIDLPSENLPLSDLLARREADTNRRLIAAQSRDNWLDFYLDQDVVLLALIGDPHLDDNYCNFSLLRKHLELIKANPDIFVVPLGDTTNNWVGKLTKEYMDQDTTRTQALQLITWFFDCVRPRININGNHDNWSTQENLITYLMEKQTGHDARWQARCKLKFPNGWDYKCWFAHDFPGRSKTSLNHSEMTRLQAAGEHIHLLGCGHRHYWATQSSENEYTKEKFTFVRAKGYKDWDSYGETLGYGNQRSGHTIGVVVNSKTKEATTFDSLERAFEYYTHTRSTRT